MQNEIIGARVKFWNGDEGRVLMVGTQLDRDGDVCFVALVLMDGELVSRLLEGARIVRPPDALPPAAAKLPEP